MQAVRMGMGDCWGLGSLLARVVHAALEFFDAVEDREETAAEVGEAILDARRDLGIGGAFEDAEAEHLGEALVEDLGAQAADGAGHRARPIDAAADKIEDVERPLAPDDGLDHGGDVAGGHGDFAGRGLDRPGEFRGFAFNSYHLVRTSPESTRLKGAMRSLGSGRVASH